jgi:dihydrofolate synthase/folylpolyglutamate synthase
MAENPASHASTLIYEALLTRLGEGLPQPRLDPTRRAAELLGSPHESVPIIHVTGTNGKTTASRVAASILRAHGLSVGLFTSPHLVRFNERIVIGGHPINDASLSRAWLSIQSAITTVDEDLVRVSQPRLTFFEVMTVLAFTCFAQAAVDVAVIEVGIGGQWDSTNIADGSVAVFPPISLDHTRLLGSTIAEIARTKSGIIKGQVEVVTAKQEPEALFEIERMVQLTDSVVAVERVNFEATAVGVTPEGQLFKYRGFDRVVHESLPLPLFGIHQVQNAGVAIAAVQALLSTVGRSLDDDNLVLGLRATTSPGRLEIIQRSPLVILDAAHNPSGAASLVSALRDQFAINEVAFVVGILEEKDASGIIRTLAPSATRFLVTQSRSERSIAAEQLSKIVASIAPKVASDQFADLASAMPIAAQWASGGPRRAVVVTGSITLIAEAYSVLPLFIANDDAMLSADEL